MSPSSLAPALLLSAGLLLACQREAGPAGKAPVVIDARVATPASVVAPPVAAEPPRAPFVDPLGAATIELSGAVIFPPGPPPVGRVFVFVSIGDCLDAAVPPLRRMPVTEDGAFLLHALATPGNELSVCAALEGGSMEVAGKGGGKATGSPSVFYGQAANRIRIEQTTDLVLHDLQIPLRLGPPRRFAAAAKPNKS